MISEYQHQCHTFMEKQDIGLTLLGVLGITRRHTLQRWRRPRLRVHGPLKQHIYRVLQGHQPTVEQLDIRRLNTIVHQMMNCCNSQLARAVLGRREAHGTCTRRLGHIRNQV